MGDNDTKKGEVEVGGLGLIDVSSEDDSLLFSSFLDPTGYQFSETDKDEKGLKDDKELTSLKDTHNCDEEILVSTLEEKEEVLQPQESPEPQKMMKSRKYNLRKSLAWDNAFFTSAGVLEPEELSSMMESNHSSGKQTLPTIEEDLHRSTESISTFQSDCTVENNQEFSLFEDNQEFSLFEDVRASIQRSAKTSYAATPRKYNQMQAKEVATSPTSTMVEDPTSEEKTKPKASPKNSSVRGQGLRNTTKQPVAMQGLSISIAKPSNGLSKVRPLSTTSTNRASVNLSKTKQENNSKLPGGKEHVGPRTSILRSARPILPKSTLPFKSSVRSSAASKNELTSSCSSLESCASASSTASHKSSLDLIKKKNDQSFRLPSQSLANGRTSRSTCQPRIPPPPTNKTSKSAFSSSRSSAGSISDCSSESSLASATSNIAKCNQKPVYGERGPGNTNTVQSKDISLLQADTKEGTKRGSPVNSGVVRPTSMRATGLRVPSPKIGFFDGAKSVTRTPTGNIQPRGRPGAVASGLSRHGSSSFTGTKPGKSQSAKSPSSKTKTSPRLASVSVSSPKLLNKMYTKINAEDQLEG